MDVSAGEMSTHPQIVKTEYYYVSPLVTTFYNHSSRYRYEKKSLSAHLATHGTDPLSKKPLATDQVITNKLVREAIEFYDSGAKAPSDEVPEFLLDPISYEALEDPLTTKYGRAGTWGW